MSKSKSKGAKPSNPSDLLSMVKSASVTKPAQSVQNKSKDLAKKVVAKEEKKNKKKVKEPTPDPSSEEEEEDSDGSSESEESDSEVETKPAMIGKSNGAKASAKAESSDESDENSEESDSDVETPAANGTKVAPAADSDESADESDESDDSSGDSGGENEELVKKSAVMGKKVEATSDSDADSESEDDSEDSGSEDSGSEDSGSEEDSEGSESEADVKHKTTKRKAEEEETPAAKKTKTEVDISRGANLFIGNLSWNVDEAWLTDEFSGYGELNGVRVMTDRATGRSKGFAYVEFVHAADAAKAHADKQGAELDGRTMNVDFANARPTGEQKQDNRRKSYGDSVSEPSDTLFVGNLSFDVGQDAVSQAFAPHGTILGVRLPTDRETGQPKGFGYVTFASAEEAQAAMEAMQGYYLEKRPLRLDFSQPRPQQGDSPARGGFGGRGRGGFGGGRGGGRGRGGGDFRGGRGGTRGGRGASTNRGGFGDFSGRKTTF